MRNENWRFAAIDKKAELSSEGKSAAEGNGYVVTLSSSTGGGTGWKVVPL